MKLWVSTVVPGLVPLLRLLPRYTCWCIMPWKVIHTFALLAFLFFLSCYSSYGFIQCGDQTMKSSGNRWREERFASLMLKEAVAFIYRYEHGFFLFFVSFLHVHTPPLTREKFVEHSKYGLYGDHEEEMDWMVGKLLDAVDDFGLRNHTLVHLTSDI
ncbi:hypothetical protein MC885_004302 [Smutsia gigantea]|nr:hypothetical protein MC885_004302 [Smutsia gigantea]